MKRWIAPTSGRIFSVFVGKLTERGRFLLLGFVLASFMPRGDEEINMLIIQRMHKGLLLRQVLQVR